MHLFDAWRHRLFAVVAVVLLAGSFAVACGDDDDDDDAANGETPTVANGEETPANGEDETPTEAEDETPTEAEDETPTEAEDETPENGETPTPENGDGETPGAGAGGEISEGDEVESADDIPEDAQVMDQVDISFVPNELTVEPGETVYFMSSDQPVHTVTIEGTNVSGDMQEGDIIEWDAPEEPGDYEVTCDYHPEMMATITVEEGGGQ